jgi:hypothetical protein
MKARTIRAFVLGFMLLVPIPAVPAPPEEIPLFEQIQDINPCSGELITLTLSGVAVIREVRDQFHLRGSGQVITSDGYTGTFNRTFFFKGNQIETLRFHDMELNSTAASPAGASDFRGTGASHRNARLLLPSLRLRLQVRQILALTNAFAGGYAIPACYRSTVVVLPLKPIARPQRNALNARIGKCGGCGT